MEPNGNPQQTLRRSLAATLAYFDLFDRPLTLTELLRFRYAADDAHLTGKWSHADVLAALDDPAFGHADGLWHLAGREGTVATRQRRARLADAKFARARRVAGWLRLLPSVRMIAVCNSLALENADVESDIDLFVVASPGTLWATRFVAVAALTLLGMRPTSRTHADRVCMSYFVTTRHMDLSRLALDKGDDDHLRYWIAAFVPVYDADRTFGTFMAANAWIRERLPNFRPDAEAAPLSGPGSRAVTPAPRWTAALLPLLRALERPARAVQMRLFPKSIRTLANADTRVVVSDDVLKFHVNDRRAEYNRRFRERLAALPAPVQAPPARLVTEPVAA